MDSDSISCTCSTDLSDTSSEPIPKISSLPELESSLLPSQSTPDTSELLNDIENSIENEELFNQATKILGKPVNSNNQLLNEMKNFKNLSYKNVEIDFEAQASFLKEFNSYFGVYATNLKDAEAYLKIFHDQTKPTIQDKLKDNLSKDREELNRANQQISKLKSVINDLENQLNSYRMSSIASDELQSDSDHQLSIAQSKIQSLQKQVDSLEVSKSLTEHALADFGNLIESQQKEIANLTIHREKLIRLLKTHFDATKAAAMYKPVVEKPAPVVIKQEYTKPDDLELNLIFNIISNSKVPEFIKREVEDLYTDVRYSECEKINNIINNLVKQINCLEQAREKANIARDEIEKRNDSVETHAINTLMLFEEQIRFLQKISRNNELQDALIFRKFNPTPMHLDKCTQEELAKKCAELSKYVEDEVGIFSEEKVKCCLKKLSNVDSNLIFELQKSSNMSERIANLNEMLNTNTPCNRELFDVVVCQVFINDALCNLCKEMKSHISYMNKEMAKVPQISQEDMIKIEKQEAENHEKTLKIEELEELQEKLIKAIKKLLPQKEKCQNVTEMLNAAIKHNKQLKSSIKLLIQEESKLRQELEVSQERVTKKSRQIKIMGQAMQKQNKTNEENSKKLAELNELTANQKKEIDNMKQNHSNQIEELKKLGDSIETSMKDKLDSLKNEYEEKIIFMKQEIEAKDRQNKIVSDEKESLLSEIEQINRKNQESIDKMRETTNMLRQQYDAVLINLKDAKQEKEFLISKIEEFKTQIKVMEQQNQSIEVIKRANELKVKTLEEKFETEKKTMSTQFEAKQNALEAKYSSEKANAENIHTSFVNNLKNIIEFANEDELHLKIRNLLDFYAKYNSQIKSMEDIQCMLNCHGCFKSLSIAVKNLIEEKQKEVEVEKIVYKVDPCVESMASSARKWDSWSRRVLSSVCEGIPQAQDTDKVRQCLEEIILSASHNRRVTDRLNTLRAEKVIMINHTRDLLRQKSVPRARWTSVLPIVMSCIRMMRSSGYVELKN